MLPTPTLLDPETASWLLRDSDGSVRAALICWGIVLSAFVILRIPREVLLGCLIVAGATVGLAATVVEMKPEPATASQRPSEYAALRGQIATPRITTPRTTTLVRDPAEDGPQRQRPY